MKAAVQMTGAFFESQGLKYSVIDEERGVMRVGFAGIPGVGKVEIYLFFNTDSDVAIRCFNFVQVPEDKTEKMYHICSSMNRKFRWVKFYVNDDDNALTAEDDAIIQLDSCGEEVHGLILRMVGIIKEAYPEFMKALWT